MSQLTILIPTSPIPSHPSTEILDETIANIRKYTDAKIIIMFDGVHESLKHREHNYQQYIRNVLAKTESYGDCKTFIYHDHDHQSRMTKDTLDAVTTPLIMFVEHDTSPIGDIPFQEICDIVEKDPVINYVRFNIFDRIPEEHSYLMVGEPFDYDGVRLQRTIQWSQRPHIAKTSWYRDLLVRYFTSNGHELKKSMIEDVMHGVVQTSFHELNKDIFGLCIYTPEGNQLRSYHSDARKDDEKVIYG